MATLTCYGMWMAAQLLLCCCRVDDITHLGYLLLISPSILSYNQLPNVIIFDQPVGVDDDLRLAFGRFS